AGIQEQDVVIAVDGEAVGSSEELAVAVDAHAPGDTVTVEVVRGGGSDLWGSSALGGVIQLLTATPGEPAASAVLEGGTHGQLHAGAGVSRRFGRFGASLDASRVEAGYPVVRRGQRGAIDIDATSEATALYGKLDAAVSPATTLSLRGNLFDEERGNGTPLTSNGTFGGYLSAGVAHSAGERGEWAASLTAQRQSFDSTFSSQAPDRASEVPSLDQFDVTAESLAAAAQWTGSVTAGLDARWTGAENAEDFLFSAETGRFQRRRRAGGEQLQGGIYLQKDVGLGERWRFTAGGRVDAWSHRDGFRVERTLDGGTVLLAEEFPDRDDVAVSPRLSLVYAPRQALRVRGALYQAFRAPTINELYRPFRVRNDITAANPALDPETLTGAELGLDLGNPRSSARLTAFWNRLEDPVANVTLGLGPGTVGPCGFVPAGGSCRQRQNLGSVRVTGLEAEAEHRPAPAWSVSANYLLSHPEIRDSPREPALEGNRLAQVPEHQVVVRLSHSDPEVLAGSLQVRYTGEQFEDDLNTLELDDAVVADLLLRRRLRPGLDLFVAVENLLDETVEAGLTADGLVSIGAPRLIRGGLRLLLGGTR
ncbi:MAG TPA: TonB-dependent receptor, partial [Thermoanaerobaculia bacterium]|nr:TonB-dependent receptor [Thermoanaerobaculia bacterium]